ncbi:MAG: radical SAM/SPASM domain-containing protein [Desulfocapsaceae bacterium]|nr:radical SAM/SPASM domain-containing protein [Desulfocapsaceae bacterium]
MKAEIKPRINLDDRTPLQDVIPLATPFVLFVDPSSACNFQCTFCPTGDRGLIGRTGRYQGSLDFDLYRKIIDELPLFPDTIKVLRLYKDGEPFLNRNLVKMVAYARQSGNVPYIDTTTNGTLLDPKTVGPLIEAGLDKINISVDGMNDAQYLNFTKYPFNFRKFVDNVKWLYEHKGNLEVVIKIPKELITEAQQKEFYETFGDYCDRIFIENFAPCWPDFDVEARTGITISQGIYQQPLSNTDVCPYIFYGMSVNAGGEVSACFLDWQRKLIIGDAKKQTLAEIWNSREFNRLRIDHLEGRRREMTVCSHCGQLTHCLPDNIDAYRQELLARLQGQG